MIGMALIAMVNLYGRGLQQVFSTTPIPAIFWGPPFAFALGILCMDETRKVIVRAYPNVSLQLFSSFWVLNMLRWPKGHLPRVMEGPPSG